MLGQPSSRQALQGDAVGGAGHKGWAQRPCVLAGDACGRASLGHQAPGVLVVTGARQRVEEHSGSARRFGAPDACVPGGEVLYTMPPDTQAITEQ